MSNRPSADDADLEDLLAPNNSPFNKGSKGGADHVGSVREEIMDLDLLTKNDSSQVLPIPVARRVSLPNVFYAHCRMLFLHRPLLFLATSVVIFFVFFTVFVNTVLNPTVEIGVIANDYSDIHSAYDFEVGKVDHWCLHGGNNRCRCEDPLHPASRAHFPSWVKAYNGNKKMVQSYRDSKFLDVAFLGESLVEEMNGRWMGSNENDRLKTLERRFRKRFKKDDGAEVEGVALGIAGDTAPNVLWRILNGEVPDDFNPKIWWISLGMNDLTRMQCSEEIVVLGILRVVEEIHERKPHAKIVLNSLLPMSKMRGAAMPARNDFEDAFQTYKKKRRNRRHENDGDEEERQLEVVKAMDYADGDNEMPEREFARNRKEKQNENEEIKEAMSKEWNTRKNKRLKHVLKKKELDELNPELKEKNTVKKRDAKKLFLKENDMPLWPSILSINEELRKFAMKHDHITFFDATSVFARREEGENYILKSNFISNRGHPTDAGFKRWEDAIVEKIQYILSKPDPEEDEVEPEEEMMLDDQDDVEDEEP